MMAALKKVDLAESPSGPVSMDQDGNPVVSIFVRKLERADGKLRNTVVHTFPKVTNYWNYSPAEFAKVPEFSRDYPPCKYCAD
jgi:branched-chain amino acid transport system substrate-binding protein